jgi:hypothetical protein
MGASGAHVDGKWGTTKSLCRFGRFEVVEAVQTEHATLLKSAEVAGQLGVSRA